MKTKVLLIVFIFVLILSNVYGQTSLSGTITSDTTLLKSKSPYLLTSSLTVKNNANLTIENGCTINIGSYNIIVGSSTPGNITASDVTFSSTSTSDKYIDFKDGGTGSINNCNFNNVYNRVEDDAGSNLSFTSNTFTNIDFPFKISPNSSPAISGNSSPIELIGLQGNVTQSTTLKKFQWDYQMTGTLNIQENATLGIERNVKIDLQNYYINVGYSTSGTLNASNSSFFTLYKNKNMIVFKDGGSGNILNCSFDKVSIKVEGDATNDININGNNFTNIECPVLIDVNRIPTISNNTSSIEIIGLFGSATNDILLNKYDWDYILTANVNVQKGKTLTIGNGINIDLSRFYISAGYTTSGVIFILNASLISTYTSNGHIYFKDGGSGAVSNSSLNNVYIKIEDDADNNILINNNQFSNINFPVELSANRAPVIFGNNSTVEKIGLFGNVTSDNELPKYQWDYELSGGVSIKNNKVLKFADNTSVDLCTKYINVGVGSNSTGTLNATSVSFNGRPENRGRINFNTNSSGNIYNCSFEKCYIEISNCSPVIHSSRFFHCQTAIAVKNAANPILKFNDFYNNVLSINHSGTLMLDATDNFWGHNSGPQNIGNPDGIGELAEGNIICLPKSETPNTGSIEGTITPSNFNFVTMITGEKVDTSFTIKNEGDIDLLITNIQNNTSNVSVQSYDRFWLLPDSNLNVNFSFTSLKRGEEKDTITISTNNSLDPELEIMLSARGNIESLLINFNKLNIDSFPLVKCYFTVTDQANIPIGDIEKSFITLKEDGIEIPEFDFITKADVSSIVSATLVIDQSGSMSGQKLRDAKNASNDFVDELSVNDFASVISFSNEVRIKQDFTSDKTALTNAINSLSAYDETALFDAIAVAIENIKNMPGNKAIIALTDGMDNSSNISPDILVSMALQYGISIYTVGLGDDAEESTIRYVADLTGGKYFFAPTSDDLSIIYKRITGQLQNQYIITYQAPEDNPFPRTVELTIDYYDLSVTDSINYTIEKQEIEFLTSTQPFMLNEFTKNSKSYFYYKTSSLNNILSVGEEISYIDKVGSIYIPFGGKYLGDSILQFWVELYDDLNRSHLDITIPDSIIHNGSWIKFTSKPEPFEIPLVNYLVTQNIDVFAGVTMGVKLLAGGVGAGPSVAAASLSVKGTGGMGLNFEVDSKGNELITRRFEAGVGLEAESPAINGVVGDVQAGAEAGVMVKGTLGQTMQFDSQMDNDEIKAKTLFYLETFGLGAMSLSPDCSILKYALKQSLSLLSGGMMFAYNDHYYSELYGLNIEGSASVGLSVASGSGSDQNKLKLAEVGGSMVFSGQFIDYKQNNDKSINFGYALEAGFSVLSLDVMGVDLGMVAGFNQGLDFNIGANFNPASGFNAMNISLGLSESYSIIFGQQQNRREISFSVPEKVITRAMNSTNIIRSVAPFFNSSFPKMDFQIGKDYFLNSIDDMFTYSSVPLDNVDNHILIEVTDSKALVVEIDASVEIDGALVLGGGLELGVTLSYADEMSTISSQSTIVDGKLLPLADYNDTDPEKLFSIKDEIEFLLDKAPKLVLDLINALVDKIIKAIEAGVDFVIESADGACTFTGNIVSSGYSIVTSGFAEIASYSPGLSTFNPFKSAFTDPKVINAYISRRVISPSDSKAANNPHYNRTLCLISNCYRVNVYNDNGDTLEYFDPSLLTIAINQGMFENFGFTEEDKSSVRIYYYNFLSLNWEEITIDLNEDSDTVSALISMPGTYAAGIVSDPMKDKTAPEIQEYYPVDGGIFEPDSMFWAKLYEPALGIGLSLVNSSLEIDGAEVDAVWDPVNNIISFKTKESIASGVHTFKITAVDFNSNKSEKVISFTIIRNTSVDETGVHAIRISCYPNPAQNYLNIDLLNCDKGNTEVDIYNVLGQKIKLLYNGKIYDKNQELIWDRTNESGILISPGIYFVRVKNDDRILIKKIIAK